MFRVKIADIVFEITCEHALSEQLCRDYITDSEPQETVVLTAEHRVRERELAEKLGIPVAGEAELEYTALSREICECLHRHGAIMLHCAAIEYGGEAILFCARSGVGKSTHISYWRAVFGERVRIINGDKPVIRTFDSSYLVCGTPFSGKEGWQRNTMVPLRAIVLLERGESDICERISPEFAVKKLTEQSYIPRSPEGQLATIGTVFDMAQSVPIYRLAATKSEMAARVAFNAIINNE